MVSLTIPSTGMYLTVYHTHYFIGSHSPVFFANDGTQVGFYRFNMECLFILNYGNIQ